jgi:hypothetical protein
MNLSTFRQIDHIREAFLLVVTFIILVFSNSPMVYGQNTSFSPFSLLDKNSITGDINGDSSSVVDHNLQPSQENPPNFQPVFAAIDPKSSASSNLSSMVKEQNETQQQISSSSSSSSSSSPRHPRGPLTQYQTIVQTPGRTLAVQPTSTLPPATLYPPGIGTGTAGTTIFPQTTLAGTGTLPQSAVTFPPSVFPPTTSFIPPTSIAPVTGPLSPWFPSIPAIACGGTFTFSVVGSLDRDNDNGNDNGNDDNKDNNKNDKNDNNNDKDKLYAIQIQSNGGSSLDTDTIEGKVFAGENNIERNNGEDFDIKDVFNDCQVVTFSN